MEVKKELQFRDFKFGEDHLVCDYLDQNPVLINDRSDLMEAVERMLISARYVLPSKSQLMRFVHREYNKKQGKIFDIFSSSISKSQSERLKFICEGGDFLSRIKRPIGEVNIKNISEKLGIIEELLSLKMEALPWEVIHPSYSEKLARLIHKYDRSSIKRIRPEERRNVMMMCYLYESSKSLMDLLVNSYDKLMGEIERRVNRDFEEKYRTLRQEARVSREKSLSALILLNNHENKSSTTLEMFCAELKEQDKDLGDIIEKCKAVESFERDGKSELFQRRYGYLKDFCFRFLNLQFKVSKGMEPLMQGLEIYRKYHQEKRLPGKVPYSFMDNIWKRAICKEDQFNMKAWEIGLFFAVKKGLRSGNLYLPQSRYYRDFWSPMYDEQEWQRDKKSHYKELNVPERGSKIIKKLREEFEEQLHMAVKSFDSSNYAEIKHGKLLLHKEESLGDSESLKELKELLNSYIEPIRIEDLLSYVQRKTNYMKAFKALEGLKRREMVEPHILNAAITGHATNLGLYGISRNCNGINGDKLSYISNYYISVENLKEANNILIEAQQCYWLTSIIGPGKQSSSDGERFRTSKRGLYSSIHPRYFGALDRGITIYTHMSDQCSVFNTEIISCGVREAVYVLDGLLDNQSVVRPFEHSTDTAGFTEIVFALCYLLGISFHPHFKAQY